MSAKGGMVVTGSCCPLPASLLYDISLRWPRRERERERMVDARLTHDDVFRFTAVGESFLSRTRAGSNPPFLVFLLSLPVVGKYDSIA